MSEIKFKVENWMPALTTVGAVVNSKNVIPILGSVMIDSKDGTHCTLIASDGETWVSKPVTAESADAGIRICVAAADLIKTLKNLDGEYVVSMNVPEDSHIATFDYGKGHFSLPYMSSDDYPIPSDIGDDYANMVIGADKIANAISSVAWAVGNDTIRPILNVLHFDFTPNGLSVCGTDATKLSVYKDKDVTTEEVRSFNLPQRPANILLGIIGAMGNDEVNMAFNEKAVSFCNDNFTLTTRLTEGRYPDYERLIPKQCPITIKINKADFMDALRRITPLGSSNELVALNFVCGMVTASTEDVNFSKAASEKIDCDYFGSDFKIGFKGSFLLDILRSVQGETAVIELTDQSRAGLFYGEGTKDAYLAILMPMVVN